MCFPLVSAGILIAWMQGLEEPPGPYPTPPGLPASEGQTLWASEAVEGGTCGLGARLVPLHLDPGRQAFEARVLKERFQLGPGEPWSLQLTLPESCEGTRSLVDLRMIGAPGELHPLAAAQGTAGTDLHDPVRVLFDQPRELHPGERRRLVLWGPRPEGPLILQGLGEPLELQVGELGANGLPADQLDAGTFAGPAHGAETADLGTAPRPTWAAEKESLELEILRLRGELENALEDRVARENEYLAWQEMLSGIVPEEAPPELYALFGKTPPLPEPPAEEALDPVLELRRERSREVYLGLRALMVVERLDSLDLLESGMVELGYTGPVVFRQLDERGRPVGSLSADRLRLEGSRIARTLTIILEDGYERRGGQTIPFDGTEPGEERGGTRRIFLQNTDPQPWFESAPELFEEENLEVLQDDGTWRVFLVHRKLNELLGLDAALGHYRVVRIAGILDDELRGVELEQLDRDGKLVKRLFADRLTIHREPKGVQLLLRDGIQMRGGNKLAFLEGRYRIFLPGADQIQWNTAGLPGLTPAKESPLGAVGR